MGRGWGGVRCVCVCGGGVCCWGNGMLKDKKETHSRGDHTL